MLTDGDARHYLDIIHARMCCPWEWSADTPESIWQVLDRAGYRMPEEHEVEQLLIDHDDTIPVREFAPWRP